MDKIYELLKENGEVVYSLASLCKSSFLICIYKNALAYFNKGKLLN